MAYTTSPSTRMNWLLIFLSVLFSFSQSLSSSAEPPKASKKTTSRESSPNNEAEQGKLPSKKFGAKFDKVNIIYTGGKYDEQPIPFLFKTPKKMEAGKKYPLVVWLHGHGPVEYSHNTLGKLNWVDKMFPNNTSDACYVLVPACFNHEAWFEEAGDPSDRYPDGKGDEVITMLREMIDQVVRENSSLDADAITVLGISSGGTATWEFAMRNPGLLAAIVPLSCVGGDHNRLHHLRGTIVWAFHNRGDKGAPVEKVIQTVQKCYELDLDVSLTIKEKDDHNTWIDAFNENDLRTWLLVQRRGQEPYWGDLKYQWNRFVYSKNTWKFLGFSSFASIIVIAALLEQKRRKKNIASNAPEIDSAAQDIG